MNRKVRNNEDLNHAIKEVRRQREIDFLSLKSQMDESYKELQPSRLVKRIFLDLKEEPQVKHHLTETIVSIVGGFISKRLLIGKSSSIVKSLLGYLIQLGTTKLIANKIK